MMAAADIYTVVHKGHHSEAGGYIPGETLSMGNIPARAGEKGEEEAVTQKTCGGSKGNMV